jgi:heat shock protein HslJ
VKRFVAALSLTALAGCAGTAPPPQDAAAKPVTTAGAGGGSVELLNTDWKILSMAGEPVKAQDGRREPRISLRDADGRTGWSATVGCNQMSGGLSFDGDRIGFKAGMATLMACPPPLDTLEKQLGQSLLASTHWRIHGNRLELRDDAGVQTFLCEAAVLP